MNTTTLRFKALDVFRGMTICLMIIVNTPGSWNYVYSPLDHAAWNGFTPTDLVFPSFLFAVGNAMSFVIPKWEDKGHLFVIKKVLIRTIILFLIGYLLNWFPFFRLDDLQHIQPFPFSETRILGVLQRIALAYGMASLLIHFFTKKQLAYTSLFILIAYWGILYFMGNSADPYSIQGNAVLKLDTWMLGSNHLYMGEGFPFDPEGILSTFPSIVNVIAGYMTGYYLQKKGKNYESLFKIILVGFICFVIAWWWNLILPINKKIWTSSYVVLTIGLDCMILAAIVFFLDIQEKNWGVFFFDVFGRNPLFIYLLSELGVIILSLIPIQGTNISDWVYSSIFSKAGDYLGSFLYAVVFMFCCWLPGYFLFKKKIYIRI
ncbi:MAG: DUF5009 domain-containing protein [Bacteroidetes bacterium]|nr:DUF5009 domain-containing protein [Bacteroidota bacterium]